MQQWEKTTGTMVSCEVEDYDEDYQLSLSYAYSVGGVSYTGECFDQHGPCVAYGIGEIKRLEKKWAAGTAVDVFYNPKSPVEAVLEMTDCCGPMWLLPFGISLVVAAFGLFFAALPWILGRIRDRSDKSQPGRVFLIIIGGLFLAVGLISIIHPLLKCREVKHWEIIPATVVASNVKAEESSNGTTYYVYIAYRYSIDGQEYFNDQYNFDYGSSMGRRSKEKIVKRYPVGREFKVFVNPENPAESVIRPQGSLSVLMGVVFVFPGLLIFLAGLLDKAPSKAV